MAETVVYIAIFKSEKMSVTIEYLPLAGGAIEIVSCDLQERPMSAWQERELDRRKLATSRQAYGDLEAGTALDALDQGNDQIFNDTFVRP